MNDGDGWRPMKKPVGDRQITRFRQPDATIAPQRAPAISEAAESAARRTLKASGVPAQAG
jgi:hypothetical protein